jgi:hypothetical protein
MMIYMASTPFSMYENQTKLKGNLLLRSSGLRGSGLLDWKEANITSKDFRFRSDDLAADTAALDIKSATGDKITFKAPNVNAKIDFKGRVGDFKTNTPDIPTQFAYNDFKTTIGEFKWDIDKKILDFKVPTGSSGEYFTSTRESQMGLKFLAKRATYNLETSILRVEQVPYIYIADAKVVPDSGVVVIQGEAKIDQLKNATIYVDTATSKHKITSCTVDIISKAELRGSGTYSFSCAGHKDEKIVFNDIKCTKETIGDKKKDKFDEYSLGAKGNIEDKDSFYIYPRVTFKGESNLYGKNPYLFFKGFAKINFKNPDVTSSDFKIVDDVNPDKLFLHYDSVSKSSDGSKVVTGIYFNKSGETPSMYHAIFTQMQNQSDLCLFRAPGVVTYNEKTGEYLMGDEDKIEKGTLAGNLMRYNDDKGTIKGEGEMSLGATFGVIRSEAAGVMDVDLKKKQYTFNMTFGLDMKTNNKALDEKLQTIMLNDNTDLPDINYEGDKFKKIYSNLADPKVDEKLIKDMETTPMFKRPKDFDYNLVFSDVNFIYDADDLTLRSYGKIGLAFVGEKGIHKKLDGYIEIGLKNNNINIYLKTGANEWFFFEYKPNSLGMISSYDDYNRIIGTMIMTPADKRKITGEKNQWYVINLGSTINKSAFLDAMKEKSNPLLPAEKVKPRPPRDSTAIKAPRGGDATPQPGSGKKDIAPVDTAKTNAVKKAEDAMTPAQRRAAKLRGKAGQEEVPAPVDTAKKSAPANPVIAPVDTTSKVIKQPGAPVKQPEVAQPKPVDTTSKVIATPATPPVTPPVDTTSKAPVKQPDPAPVKQPEVSQPAPVTPPADTASKVIKQPDPAPVKQPEVVQPKPITPPVDTTSKAPVKQPDPAPVKQPEVAQPNPVVPAADTTNKAVKQPDVAPVTPKPVAPIDSSAIKSIPMPADTSGHK